MTTVTIHDTTTGASNADGTQPGTVQRSVSEALADGVIIVDAKGRRLKLMRPNVLNESRLIRAVGSDAENQMYLNAYVLPAAMVIEIDGQENTFPSTTLQIEARIQQVGREGLAAVIKYITSQPTEQTSEGTAIKK
jgi:hypothetical protein